MRKKIISGMLAFVPLIAITCNAIVLDVPAGQGQADLNVAGPTQIVADESDFFTLIQSINTYLWFSIGVVCMAVLIIGGFKLITAQGNAEKMKQANKLLMGALIGILIAILSWSIITLVVRLFD